MKVARKTVYLEKTVIKHVLTTVTITHAIYRMDPVLDVSLDGQELHVTKVCRLNIYELTKRISSIYFMYWKHCFWLHFHFEQNVAVDHTVWIVIKKCPGHCKNNVTCDYLTGLCNGGCAAGWNGSYCNKSNDRLTF